MKRILTAILIIFGAYIIYNYVIIYDYKGIKSIKNNHQNMKNNINIMFNNAGQGYIFKKTLTTEATATVLPKARLLVYYEIVPYRIPCEMVMDISEDKKSNTFTAKGNEITQGYNNKKIHGKYILMYQGKSRMDTALLDDNSTKYTVVEVR